MKSKMGKNEHLPTFAHGVRTVKVRTFTSRRPLFRGKSRGFLLESLGEVFFSAFARRWDLASLWPRESLVKDMQCWNASKLTNRRVSWFELIGSVI
jgi:hypothetical protein